MSNVMNKETTPEIYHRFWKDLKEYLETEKSTIRIKNPSLDGYQHIKTFCKGVSLKLVITSRITKKKNEKKTRVEILLGNTKYNEKNFNLLKEKEQEIKNDLGIGIDSKDKDVLRPQYFMIVDIDDFNVWDEKNLNWKRQFAWFKETAEKFDEVFTRHLKEIETELEPQK